MDGNDPESSIKQKRSSRGASGTSDAKSRNWRFLFDNLKRAVGYIYSMCEQDGDIEECKEAIMVLHNRIKEFEGLIQYIEVQASYETSEDRPSSVAWEVPVSAIKQPSLPFQPNGEQLYYYPCLPQVSQTFPQYSMPGTFPMIDPNVVNYMSFNQPFAGYPPEYMPQNGQPPQPPAPQQYQQFGFIDYNNNNNNNVHGKKNYTKPRRSGSKHDNYKSRNSDGHSAKKVQPSSNSNNLNSLDMTPVQSEMADSNTGEYVLPVIESNYVQATSPQALETPIADDLQSNVTETSAQASIEIISEASSIRETLDADVSNADGNCDLKHDTSQDSLAVNQEIAEAINDKSSVEDEVMTEPEQVQDAKADWTVVQTTPDTFVHVTSDGSDHSLAESPEQSNRNSAQGEKSVNNEPTEGDSLSVSIQSDILEGSAESLTESEAIKVDSGSVEQQKSGELSENITSVGSDVEETADLTVEKEATEISVESSNVIQSDVCQEQEAPSEGEVKTVSKVEPPVETKEVTSETHEPSILAPKADSPEEEDVSEADDKTSPEVATPEQKKQEEQNSSAKSSAIQDNQDTALTKSEKKPVVNSEQKESVLEKVPLKSTGSSKSDQKEEALKSNQPGQVISTVPEKPIRKSASGSKNRGVKLSCSSEIVDIEGKEVDVLSESGLSTMSSSSVQSSMSLPLNPLARSTSWADLVRKGKSDSPVPATPYKNPYSSKYQSTPSRYLNHRQAGTTSKYGPRNQPALSKSKSLPNQRGLQTNKIVRSKESHVNEDGWCISSGKSRIKTIPNSSKTVEPTTTTTAAKPNDVTKSSAMSPRLSRASAKSTGDSSSSTARSKASDTKAKSSDGTEKTKSSRGIKPKPATTPSTKNVSAKVNSKPSGTKSATSTRASRPLTASSRGAAGKQPSNKRLVKTKSLESSTKLSDNLKIPDAGDIQKAISKSSETLETPSAKDKKDIGDDKEIVSEEKEAVISSVPQDDTPDTSDLSSDANEASSSSNDKSEPLSVSEADDSSALVLESADDTDAESSKISSESKSIQTDASEHAFEDHVEIFAVPASSMYPKMEEEDNCNIYRVMISKRKRQISEQSSVSTDTLDDEDHSCLSPGRSPGRSPSSRSSGGGRSPGKAPQLHQRLSSPSRKRNTTDAVLKNYTERLAKAQVQRDKIQEEKANKLKKIKIKEEQIKDLQEQQEKERFARAISHAEKLARAEQLRDKKIAEVKRKAQEEDQKVNEIVFINTLEAQNRKMELLSKEQVAESKRLELQVRQQEERKRRSEELQAKEDAVQERKQLIEADRLARIAHIEDKIKESQAKVDLNKLEMETAAKEAAKERAFEREVTIELVKSDRNNNDRNSSTDNKPSKTKNRKETSKLKEMQQKAAMLCQHVSSEYLPTHTLYQPPKWCSKCNIKIVSEAVLMSHMIKRHQKSSQDEAEVESQHIVDYTEELCPMAQDVINRQKMLRKRSKKVKTRITNKISELPTVKLLEAPKDCPNKNRLYKCIKAMKNQKNQEKGLGDLSRTVLTKTDINHLIDKGVVEQLCTMLPERQHLAPLSKLLLQSSLLSSTGSQICVRSLPDIVDCLHSHASVTTPAVYSDLLKLTSTLIRTLSPCESLTSDLISYIVSKEIIEQIQRTCTDTYNYQLKDDNGCSVLLSSLQLLSACCIAMTTPNAAISISPTKNDPSQLVDSLVFTKACNIVTLLYGVLLYEGPRRAPPPLSDMKRCVVKQCLGTLLDISRFSLHTLQTVMDSEGMSLELRHVCSFVLSCASHHTYTDILDLCVQLIGFVVFSHPSNQALLQNGPSPSILQLLSSLPFSYFSDIRSMNLLFPSLISACHDCPSNLAILQQKVNKVMLISYLKEQLKSTKEKHINFYPRPVFQQALKFLETPDVEVT